jgi:hypothetical protein
VTGMAQAKVGAYLSEATEWAEDQIIQVRVGGSKDSARALHRARCMHGHSLSRNSASFVVKINST